MPKLTGIASSSASSEVTSVPYTGASAPNWSVTGFQISRVRKAELEVPKRGPRPDQQRERDPAQQQQHQQRRGQSGGPRIRALAQPLSRGVRGSMAATVFIADGNRPARAGARRCNAAYSDHAHLRRWLAERRGSSHIAGTPLICAFQVARICLIRLSGSGT